MLKSKKLKLFNRKTNEKDLSYSYYSQAYFTEEKVKSNKKIVWILFAGLIGISIANVFLINLFFTVLQNS